MDSEDIQKFFNMKYEYFMTTLGLLFVVGGLWLYLNYIMGKPSKDIVVISSVAGGIFLGLALFLSGFIQILVAYDRKDRLEELEYNISIIKKGEELKAIKKKYNIKDKEPLLMRFWEKIQ